jgi:hypothetical protein
MNLAIVGYGKMGRMIESLAPEYGFTPALILDVHNNTNFEGLTEENFRGIHAAVEFSVPSVAVENARRLAALRIPAVMGTTGWLDRLDEVRAAVEEHDSALVWSANFSIGVNIFHRVLAEAAKTVRAPPGVRRLGMGDPSPHKKGRAERDDVAACPHDPGGRLQPPARRVFEPRRRPPGFARDRVRCRS